MERFSGRTNSLEDHIKARTECVMYCKVISRELRPSTDPNLLWYGSYFVLKLHLKNLG